MIDTIETDLLALLNRNSYEKGGFVLHMLRAQVGERAFFDAIRAYYAKHRHATAMTDDLRAEMERAVQAVARLVLRSVAAPAGLSRSRRDAGRTTRRAGRSTSSSPRARDSEHFGFLSSSESSIRQG